MKNASISRFLLVVILVCGGLASAQVPSMINYQGLLMNDDGSYPDTTVFLTFTIYDAPADGTALWTETQIDVEIENGLFEVKLGSAAPLSASVFSASNRWLGIVVGTGMEIYPRIQLVAVPYAMRVGSIDGTGGGNINGGLTISEKLTVGEGAVNDGKGTVVIGDGNTSVGEYAANIGGAFNNASANYSSIVGGSGNQAGGQYSFIGSGLSNIAGGFGSFVAGGNSNTASGDFSFAAGNQAQALHNGTIVLSANDCPT